MNKKLSQLIDESIRLELNITLNIEKSSGGLHFQLAMEKSFTSSIMKIFQELNNDKKGSLQ